MKKDLEIIEALKNKDKRRIEFFKNKIIEELNKNKMTVSDEIVNSYLKEAIENYDENIKIPFLFYLKSLIKNNKEEEKADTQSNYIFNDKDIKILNYYLNKYKNKYLTNLEIANITGYTITEVMNAIKKLNLAAKSNFIEVNKTFPNYKEKKKERKSFFKNETVSITEKQLKLLESYLNSDITETSKTHNLTKKAVKEELTKCYKLLKNKNNVNLLLKRNPNLKEETIIEKGKSITTSPKSTKKTRAKLTSINIEMLTVLYEKSNLSSFEMAKILHYKNKKSFIAAKNILFNKLRDNKDLKMKALEYFPSLNIPNEKKEYNYQITTEDKALINLLLKYKDDEEKIKNELNLEEEIYLDKKEKLLKKISKSKKLIETLKEEYKDIESILPPKELTKSQRKLLILLNETKNNPLSDEEMATRLNLKNKESFTSEKRTLFKLLRENKELLEEAKEIYKELDITPKASTKSLTENDLKMLTLLYETKNNPLSDEEIAKKLEYKSVESYRVSKSILIKKINKNKKIQQEVKKLFPNFDLTNTIKFTENEITFLTNCCYLDENTTYLSQKEISTKMNLRVDSLAHIKKNAFNKINLAIKQNYDLDIILWPNFLDDLIIRDNFKYTNSFIVNENDLKNITENKGNISKALKYLENSNYKDYVMKCSYDIKILLALRLGFFNKRPFNSEEVAKILDIPLENVIKITKDCLNYTKETYLNNISQKSTSRTPTITPREIDILKLLNKNMSNEEIATFLNIKSKHHFETVKFNLFKKLRTNPSLLETAKKHCPNIEFIINKNAITMEEETILKLMLQYKNNSKRDEEIANILEISLEETKKKIDNLYHKIQKNSELKKYITSKYGDYIEIKTLFEPITLTESQKEKLELFNKYKNELLSDDEIAKLLGYKNSMSFINAKNRVLRKSKNLSDEEKETYTVIKSSSLSQKNLELLNLLNSQEKNSLKEEEIAKRLNYKDVRTYRIAKSTLIKKIEADSSLQEKVKRKFPSINLKETVSLTEKEINLLKEYCYLTEEHKYQQKGDIASKLGISIYGVNHTIKRAVDKIKRANIEGKVLNITFNKEFFNELMIRNNFHINNSFYIDTTKLIDKNYLLNEENILKAIEKIENSIFKDYVKDCTYDTKILLALRLGYFNKRTFSSEEVSEILNIKVETVIKITKECLEHSKENFYNSINNGKENAKDEKQYRIS